MPKAHFGILFFLACLQPIAGLAQTASIHLDSLFVRLEDPAISLYEKERFAQLAIEIALKENDPEKLAKAYSKQATIQLNLGQYDEALKLNFQAIKLAEELNVPDLTSKINYQIGNVYLRMNFPEEALPWMYKALKKFQKLENTRWEAIVFTAIGVINFQKDQLDSGLVNMNKAIVLLESEGLESDLRIPLNNIGYFLLEKDKPDEALPYFNRTLQIEHESGSPNGTAITLSNLAYTYQALDQNKKALSLYEEALHIAQNARLKQTQSEILKDMSGYYKSQGNLSLALEYFQSYHQLKDSLLNEEIANQLAELTVLHRTEQAERALKDSKAVIATLRSSKLVNQIINLLFVIAGLILALIIYLWYSRNKARNQFVQLDLEKKEQIQQQLEKELDLRKQDLTNFALDIARKNAFSNQVHESLSKMVESPPEETRKKARELLHLTSSHLQINDDIRQFQENVERVNQEFFQKLLEKYPTMTSGERHLCGLIRLNLSIKDISVIRNVNTKTVEMARYRLRKKLGLEPHVELNTFVQSF